MLSIPPQNVSHPLNTVGSSRLTSFLDTPKETLYFSGTSDNKNVLSYKGGSVLYKEHTGDIKIKGDLGVIAKVAGDVESTEGSISFIRPKWKWEWLQKILGQDVLAHNATAKENVAIESGRLTGHVTSQHLLGWVLIAKGAQARSAQAEKGCIYLSGTLLEGATGQEIIIYKTGQTKTAEAKYRLAVYGTVLESAVSKGGNVDIEEGGQVQDAITEGHFSNIDVRGTVKGKAINKKGSVEILKSGIVNEVIAGDSVYLAGELKGNVSLITKDAYDGGAPILEIKRTAIMSPQSRIIFANEDNEIKPGIIAIPADGSIKINPQSIEGNYEVILRQK